jgi:hypothetical protein
MLEGAKSIGVGAATIALAGAAVSIGIIQTIFPSVHCYSMVAQKLEF